MFLRIWKGGGRASGGLEGFSLYLEGSGDLEEFRDLERFLGIWKDFRASGKNLRGFWSTLGWVICLKKVL